MSNKENRVPLTQRRSADRALTSYKNNPSTTCQPLQATARQGLTLHIKTQKRALWREKFFYFESQSEGPYQQFKEVIARLGGSCELFLGGHVTHLIISKQRMLALKEHVKQNAAKEPKPAHLRNLIQALESKKSIWTWEKLRIELESALPGALKGPSMRREVNELLEQEKWGKKGSPLLVVKPVHDVQSTASHHANGLLDETLYQPFSHYFVLIEDAEHKYRPVYKEWKSRPPQCHYDAPEGSTPFHEPSKSKKWGPLPSTEKWTIEQKLARRRQEAIQLAKWMQTLKQGYCECCGQKYEDMMEHVKSAEHRQFALDDRNYRELDQCLLQLRRPLSQRHLCQIYLSPGASSPVKQTVLEQDEKEESKSPVLNLNEKWKMAESMTSTFVTSVASLQSSDDDEVDFIPLRDIQPNTSPLQPFDLPQHRIQSRSMTHRCKSQLFPLALSTTQSISSTLIKTPTKQWHPIRKRKVSILESRSNSSELSSCQSLLYEDTDSSIIAPPSSNADSILNEATDGIAVKDNETIEIDETMEKQVPILDHISETSQREEQTPSVPFLQFEYFASDASNHADDTENVLQMIQVTSDSIEESQPKNTRPLQVSVQSSPPKARQRKRMKSTHRETRMRAKSPLRRLSAPPLAPHENLENYCDPPCLRTRSRLQNK